MTDTRNHWKVENLGKVSKAGVCRVAADAHYKGEAVYDPGHAAPTVRCLTGGGISVLIHGGPIE